MRLDKKGSIVFDFLLVIMLIVFVFGGPGIIRQIRRSGLRAFVHRVWVGDKFDWKSYGVERE